MNNKPVAEILPNNLEYIASRIDDERVQVYKFAVTKLRPVLQVSDGIVTNVLWPEKINIWKILLRFCRWFSRCCGVSAQTEKNKKSTDKK